MSAAHIVLYIYSSYLFYNVIRQSFLISYSQIHMNNNSLYLFGLENNILLIKTIRVVIKLNITQTIKILFTAITNFFKSISCQFIEILIILK